MNHSRADRVVICVGAYAGIHGTVVDVGGADNRLVEIDRIPEGCPPDSRRLWYEARELDKVTAQ